MMYIKLMVLIGFDWHFPFISGIYKLHLLTLKVTIIKQRYLKWIFLTFILKNESFEIFA